MVHAFPAVVLRGRSGLAATRTAAGGEGTSVLGPSRGRSAEAGRAFGPPPRNVWWTRHREESGLDRQTRVARGTPVGTPPRCAPGVWCADEAGTGGRGVRGRDLFPAPRPERTPGLGGPLPAGWDVKAAFSAGGLLGVPAPTRAQHPCEPSRSRGGGRRAGPLAMWPGPPQQTCSPWGALPPATPPPPTADFIMNSPGRGHVDP